MCILYSLKKIVRKIGKYVLFFSLYNSKWYSHTVYLNCPLHVIRYFEVPQDLRTILQIIFRNLVIYYVAKYLTFCVLIHDKMCLWAKTFCAHSMWVYILHIMILLLAIIHRIMVLFITIGDITMAHMLI